MRNLGEGALYREALARGLLFGLKHWRLVLTRDEYWRGNRALRRRRRSKAWAVAGGSSSSNEHHLLWHFAEAWKNCEIIALCRNGPHNRNIACEE